MLELIGQTVDRYQVATRLGEERWGAAWKAYDPKFDRTVTLLTLDPAWAAKDGMGEYVMTTARVILRFRHPGIARILDIGQADNLQALEQNGSRDTRLDYLVQEFVPGGNLAVLLEDQRSQGAWLPIPEAVELTAEVCRALDYAHQRNLIHGGLTPGSILFKDEPTAGLPYQPVLANLGFVNPEVPDSTALSPYRAPEIGRNAPVKTTADIFSLGVLLYELLTRQAPASFPYPRPSSLRPEIPEALEQAIRKALSPDPGLRYADAGQMAAALEALLPGLRVALPTPSAASTIRLAPGERAESLHAALRRSLQNPALSSLKADTMTVPLPVSQPDLGKDQVHIREPGKDVRSVTLRPGALIIGRGQNADIQIDQPGISRHHARLEFDGKDWRVTDLHSTNGTYLEQEAVPPGEPVVWSPGENVRIGEVWLRLERGGQSATTRAFVADVTRPAKNLPQTVPVIIASGGQSFDPDQISTSSRGWVGAYVENPNLVVTPGASVGLTLMLFNRGPMTDTFYIAYEGAPAEWLANPPQTIGLPAGSDREVALTLRPPRSSLGRAGRHQFILRITSQNARDQMVELRLSVTVTAFSEFFSELQVERLRPGQVGQVLVHNRGNLPETFTVLWEDRLHELTFDPPQVKVTIPPGKTAAVEFRPALLQPRWFGSDTTHSFKVHVSAQTGQMQTHGGEYTGRSLVPAWAPIAASALCVVLACVLLLLVNQATEPARAERATEQANRTAVAMITRQAIDATQTAGAFGNALLATQQAATATAGWGSLDMDNDGLSNSMEVVAGTRLDHPDSDGDRLRDGDEVNRWKTNPILPDTDGDLLLDGDEVVRGTDPLKRDTDEDGLDDGFDPNPINRPTNTVVVIPTFTSRPPTVTPTITPTPTQQITTADFGVSISNNRGSSIPGQEVAYTIQVANRGPGAASNVAVTAALPPNFGSPTWTCAPAPGAQCLTPNGVGNINARVNLPVNGITVFTVSGVIAPNATGQFAVTTTVGAPAGVTDPNAVDNQATDVDTLTPRASLTLTVTDNRDSINAGQANSYTINVTNNGPSAVSGVSLVDNFPAEMTNVSWACVTTTGSACSVGGIIPGNVNTLVNLIPGGTATVTANGTVRPDATGTLSNTASITSPIDPLENNKSATDTTTIVGAADLELTVTNPPTVTVSTALTYTLAISNNGLTAATAVELETEIPPEAGLITYTVSTPGVVVTCGAATGRTICNLGNLAPAATVEMAFVVQAPMLPGPLGVIWELRAAQTDPNPADNTAITTVTVEASPDPYPGP